MDEPERVGLIHATKHVDLLAPPSLQWEIGNALTAMIRRGRINLDQAYRAIDIYNGIPVRFVEVDLQYAVELAHRHNTYAYDAYMLECCLRYNRPLLSLDSHLNRAAEAEGITLWEVSR